MRTSGMLNRAILAATLLASSPVFAEPSPATVVIKGEAGQVATLTVADLEALPQAGVTLSHDGKTIRYTGARLDAVLAKVDAPLGPQMRGPALADVVVIRGADGYRVVLALSDVDAGVRPEATLGPVILADRAEGQPLGQTAGRALGLKPGADGPLRLVVGGDLRPARSARAVVEIDLLRLP